MYVLLNISNINSQFFKLFFYIISLYFTYYQLLLLMDKNYFQL